MANEFNEAQFVKSISEVAFKTQINLFQQAWEGWGDQGDRRRPEQQKGSSANPFLSILSGPIGKIGEEYFKQAQLDINKALDEDIYGSKPNRRA